MLACVAALALGGCMKIYPDPELPDIEVTWFDGDCRDDANVELSLIGIDDTAFRADRVVACADTKTTFVNVARERYRIEGILRSAAGGQLGTYNEDLDLRNGLDERAEMYFGSFSNVRVAWRFAMGATCETLAADAVVLAFANNAFPEPFELSEACDAGAYFPSLPDGVYTVVGTAITADAITVAVSPPSAEFTVDFASFADVDLELAPCADQCP